MTVEDPQGENFGPFKFLYHDGYQGYLIWALDITVLSPEELGDLEDQVMEYGP